MNKMKLFALFSIVCLFMIIPAGFSAENDTAMEAAYNTSDVLTADYYFDANVGDDTGNGSATNPYKKLTAGRIADNSNIYLASGEYNLSGYKKICNVTFIGSGASDTVINFHGTGFEVSSSLSLNNVTLNNLGVLNKGTLNATNVIFKGGSTTEGGSIRCDGTNYIINLENCTFCDSHAKYGGAISISAGTLNINNCLFKDTYSELYGGAIAAKSKAILSINNTKFINTSSNKDSGGAIYIHDSTLDAYNVEIVNSTADFGAAITSLKSFVYLDSFTARLNVAKYYGGAIYAMYREFLITKSVFDENSAENGGAIYAFGVESFFINSNKFTNNRALNTAGGVYSLKNDVYYDSILDKELNNTFTNNHALKKSDVYESQTIDFYINSTDGIFISYDGYYNGTLPSSYDLRSLGQVTPVKNQGNDGNCWAFAILGALESSILKATGITLDLSEENMKDLMAEFSPYGRQMETNNGGYDSMGYSYLVNWLGPVNDSDDIYKIDAVISPLLDSFIQIQNIVFLKRNNSTDNDEIKRALMSYGGVSSNLYYTGRYLNGYNYYYDGSLASNHAVVIVGWDDDREISGAPGKGAWIVKNSWGPSWKDKGFFYISYYDSKFARDGIFAFVLNNTIKYDRNYQYDLQGYTDYYINESNTVWYKNRYTAIGNEYLTSVSTYFQKDCSWDLSVYLNGKLKLTQSGTASKSYMTIDLDQFITLKTGDVFEVVFKITADNEASFPICEAVSFTENYFTEGMSFVSWDGKNWMDLFNKTGKYSTHVYYGNQVACIKAFTIINKLNPSLELNVVSEYNPAEFEVVVRNQYGALAKSGKVTFTVEGESVQVNVENGVARLSHVFKTLGTNTIKAKFTANGYNTASKTITATIYKERTGVSLVFESSVIDYSNRYITASLKDCNANPVAQANVMLEVNGVCYYNFTDNKGMVRFDLADARPGTYPAGIYYDGNAQFNPSSALSSVTIKANTDISAIYDGDNHELIADLVDVSTGKAIANTNIVVNIAGKSYTVKTNSNGRAVFSTESLALGSYEANINYAGSSQFNPSSATVSVLNKANTKLSAVYDDNARKLIVTLTNSATGQAVGGVSVVVYIGSVSYTVKTNSAGQASLSTSSLVPGNYAASVVYNGNDKYYSSNLSIDFIVKSDTAISVVYSNKELLATLTNDFTSEAIGGAAIIFGFADANYTVKTNSAGQAKLSTKDMPLGAYSVAVSYGGNSLYNPSSTSIDFNIKTSTRISAVYNEDVREITASLFNDVTDQPVLGATIGFKINGKTYTNKTDNSGQAKLSVANLPLGTYTATVSYGGNSKYESSSIDVNVPIKANTTLDVVYNAKDKNLVATLINDLTGKAINGATVSVKINGITSKIKTDSTGQVKVSTKDLASGIYPASVSYGGNSKYYSSKTAMDVLIGVNTRISAAYKDGVLTATLVEDQTSRGINGADILVDFGDVRYTVKTDSNGQASVSTRDLAPGSYTACVSYSGSGGIPSSTSIDIQVKIDAYFVVEDISVEYGTDVELTAKLVNYATGNGIVGATVGFKFNGKSYTAKTDSNGQVKVTISGLNPGNYETAVTYNGNSKYNPAKATFNVIVNKITTSFELYYDSQTNEVVATLINGATGKGVYGGTVGIFLNNVKNIIITDKNGQVRLSLGSADPNTFTAYASYAGNTKYFASGATISPLESKTTSFISTVYDKQNAEIVTTLTNTATGKGIVGATVGVVINNAKNILRTDSAGQVIISAAGFDSGIYSISSSYSGNSKYTSTSATISQFIKKEE